MHYGGVLSRVYIIYSVVGLVMGIWEFNLPDDSPRHTPYDDQLADGEKLKADCEALLKRVREYVSLLNDKHEKALQPTLEDCEAFLPELIDEAIGLVRQYQENYIEEN